MTTEKWLDVVEYESVYQASDQGRVKRVARGSGTWPGRVLKLLQNTNGYLSVALSKNGNVRRLLVHRIVAEAFLGPQPSPDHQVNHKNGDKADNRVENLEWVTPVENMKHAIEDLGKTHIGEANGSAKLTRHDVVEIRRLYANSNHSQREIAEMFGVTQTTIGHIVRREQWRHTGGPAAPGTGHYVRGEAVSTAKLTSDDVRRIRRLYDAGSHSQRELADVFGVSTQNISCIVRRETWQHVS